VKNIPKYISDLIAQGENLTLDFKFEISDSRKIAKTFAAFANTEGGKLLIGVKDNGKIAGIRTNEEAYMLENARHLFTKPKVHYQIKPWYIEDKTILEVTIEKGNQKPYYAKDSDNKWKAYTRVNDKNLLADRVLLKFWKRNKKQNIKIKYSRKEQFLLNYLNEFKEITFEEFVQMAEISVSMAEKILVDFLAMNLIEIKMTEKSTVYRLLDVP